MTTDDLRENFKGTMSKCLMHTDVGYDYFTDEYVLWLENQIILFNQSCKTFLSDGTTTSNNKCQFCANEKWEH